MGKYVELKNSNFIDIVSFKIRHIDGVKQLEWCEGAVIDNDTIPKGKHVYQTKHGDNGDWSKPITILPEGENAVVNYCGTIISDEELPISEETPIKIIIKNN